MGLNEVLYHRQYKIHIFADTPELELDSLREFGIWSNPVNKQYILTIQSKEDPNNDPLVFERNFSEKTSLQPNQFEIEAKYGPLTLQGAVDSPWF